MASDGDRHGKDPMSLYHIWGNLKDGVRDAIFVLYRDVPDALRQRGQEKF